MKLKPVYEDGDTVVGYIFKCACGGVGYIDVKSSGGHRWYMVGTDPETARFHPSFRHQSAYRYQNDDIKSDASHGDCHFTIASGAQVFELDSATHPGETIELQHYDAASGVLR